MWGMMGKHKEELECAKEWYCLYPTNHTHPPAIRASFCVIQSCLLNKEYFDAALYARTLWETITMSRDSHIPDNLREEFTARGAMELARALWQLAAFGGMPAEEKKEVGVEAIMLARKALEIYTQLYGAESVKVAPSMSGLASVLDYFNDVDDDEVTHLQAQAKAIFIRVDLSPNVAGCEKNLGVVYKKRAKRAHAAHNLGRCIAHLELALPRVENADQAVRDAATIEKELQHVMTTRAETKKSSGNL